MLSDWQIIKNIRHRTSIANGHNNVSFRPGTCYDFANEINGTSDLRWHLPTDLQLYKTEALATPNVVLLTPLIHYNIETPPAFTTTTWFAWYYDYSPRWL
jgi:hypothetical protein